MSIIFFFSIKITCCDAVYYFVACNYMQFCSFLLKCLGHDMAKDVFGLCNTGK